ncbi:hypothetical protein [Micromonospora vulcania]|uniref:Uncharacterized protein n=1 Tax=Micromonospora vulcania TaxID=1441873 RepID=A0ABW1H3P9_9ACTN
MNRWELVVGVILGLLVNEMTDLSPWAARRLVRWAAYQWTSDPDVAAGYAEEWAAIIDERPGKLFKLLTAIQFCVGATKRATPRIFIPLRERVLRSLSGAGLGSYAVAVACVGFAGGVVGGGVAVYLGQIDAETAMIFLLSGTTAILVASLFILAPASRGAHRRSRFVRR